MANRILFNSQHQVRRGLLLGLALVLIFTTLVALSPAAAEEKITQVSGNVTQTLFTTGCTSPVGLCGSGTITGDVNGTLVGIIDSITFIPPTGTPTAVALTGTLTVTTEKGVLSGSLYTVQQLANDFTVATFTITDATRGYKGTTGVITLTGMPHGEPEHYTYTGFLVRQDD